MNALIVVHPFDEYSRGDVLTDPELITEALKTHRSKVTVNTDYIAICEAEKAKEAAPANTVQGDAAEKPPAPLADTHAD